MGNINKLTLFKQSIIHAVFEGAELEGLGLTYAKTEDIIRHYDKSKDDYTWNQIEDVKGVFNAYQFVLSKIDSTHTLNIDVLKKINELVDKYEDANAGHWRNTQKFIGGSTYIPQILSGGEYARIIEKGLKEQINFENIIKFFAKLCKTQCFNDGNKRTALIFCNAILVKNNLNVIRIINHITFARKLIDYYENEARITEFVQYVLNTSNLSFAKPHTYKQTVGETIKTLMGYYGLNENKLSIIVGVNRSHINKIINGHKKPSFELAKAIAKALHVRWETLLEN